MLISIENLLNSPINLFEDQYAIPSSLLVEPNNSNFSLCHVMSVQECPTSNIYSNPIGIETMDELYDRMTLKASQSKSKKSKPEKIPKKKSKKYPKKNK